MKKFLIITKNHPVEICNVMRRVYESVGIGNSNIFIGSPQFTALQIERAKGIPYLEAFYPAVKTYKNIDSFATEGIETIIIIGTVDIKDIINYDVVVGFDSPDIEEYKDFPEEFNNTNIKFMELKHSDIIFTKIDELIHFLRILMNRRDSNNE